MGFSSIFPSLCFEFAGDMLNSVGKHGIFDPALQQLPNDLAAFVVCDFPFAFSLTVAFRNDFSSFLADLSVFPAFWTFLRFATLTNVILLAG